MTFSLTSPHLISTLPQLHLYEAPYVLNPPPPRIRASGCDGTSKDSLRFSAMSLGLITRKVGMSRVFLPTGESVAVTFLKVDDNTVVRTKTKEKDGYQAVVLGIGEHVVRTRKGNELKKFKTQKEFKVASLEGLTPGSKVTIEAVPQDALVTLSGVSKGKGFQGVMKRHHFSGGPASHGSHFKREPGSVGMRTWPGRIHAGKRMPGHMGLDVKTIKHRPVVVSDAEKKVIGIRGAVPGANGATVYLTLEPASAPTGASGGKSTSK